MSRIRRRIEEAREHPYRTMFAQNYLFRTPTRNWLGMPSRKPNPYSTVPTRPRMHPAVQILLIGLGGVFCLAASVILAVLIRHIR